MQASSVSPVTNPTVPSSTSPITKTQQQILIQSSGAMIAVIVLGIIIILAILLIILKTYNSWTHESRVLGPRAGSKPRPKTSQSTVHSGMPLSPVDIHSVSGSIYNSHPVSENSPSLHQPELSGVEGNHVEPLSTISESSGIATSDATSIADT